MLKIKKQSRRSAERHIREINRCIQTAERMADRLAGYDRKTEEWTTVYHREMDILTAERCGRVVKEAT